MSKMRPYLTMGPALIGCMAVATAVLVHLWNAHAHYSGKPAWSVEMLRTIFLVIFLITAIQKEAYREFFVATICCTLTDLAWLVRMLHVQF